MGEFECMDCKVKLKCPIWHEDNMFCPKCKQRYFQVEDKIRKTEWATKFHSKHFADIDREIYNGQIY